MPRATARPTCEALALAMRRHGVPEAILTDNGKVFTGRFGPGTGEVLFDRICRENGIKHLLTAPRSPTTTGKVERFHRTLRQEFLGGRVFGSVEAAQAELDVWVEHYNHQRPHQGIGMVAPIERFRLATCQPSTIELAGAAPDRLRSPRQRAFGDRVRARRHELGMTREQFAEAAGIHRTYVASLEAGQRNPSLELMARVALTLGMDLGALTSGLERLPGPSGRAGR